MERNKRKMFRSIRLKNFFKISSEEKRLSWREWIIRSVCLLVRITIRGIRNLVSSLSSIEGSTIRGREGVEYR